MTSDSTPVIEGPFPPPESHDPGVASAASSGGDAVILHLTGPHRGSRQHLTETRALVGTARDAVVHFPVGADPAVTARHAILVRGDDGWSVLEVDGQVYLNSADVPGLQGRETLVPGDILEIGTGGPVIRFVMQAGESPAVQVDEGGVARLRRLRAPRPGGTRPPVRVLPPHPALGASHPHVPPHARAWWAGRSPCSWSRPAR